jgi:1-acyl-sn-glycerol-3-phosphate acyltransferase
MGALISLGLWAMGLAYYAACVVGTLALTFVMAPRRFDRPLKAAMRGLFKVLFVDVRVTGLEHVDPAKPVIYLPSPHCSMLDVPLVAGFFPGFVRGVYAAGQDRWPLYGWVMRRLGNAPIDRSDVHTSITTMKDAQAVFESGASLVVFPEGHRTTTGRALPFKKLPFHFAKQVGRPVVPVVIRGMFEVNNKTSWRMSPGTVHLHFHEAVDAEQVAALSAVELRDLLRDVLGAP